MLGGSWIIIIFHVIVVTYLAYTVFDIVGYIWSDDFVFISCKIMGCGFW